MARALAIDLRERDGEELSSRGTHDSRVSTCAAMILVWLPKETVLF